VSNVSTVVIRRSYPRTIEFEHRKFTLRVMTPADGDAVVAFARSLPETELAFLRLDLTQPAVVAEWMHNIELGRSLSLVVELEGKMVGYVSLLHDEHMWTSHLADIRAFVSPPYLELRRSLVLEAIELADQMNVERVVCRIAAEQVAVRQMLEALGFHVDALLQDWLKSNDGKTRDLLILSRPVGSENSLG
jgi:RimJ/RimL family protein N-acetyltransferase